MSVRYRCCACGNLTRFDVLARTRTNSFYHYSLSGELVVEDVQQIENEVESVTCRWCQSSSSVEEINGDEATAAGPHSTETEDGPLPTIRTKVN